MSSKIVRINTNNIAFIKKKARKGESFDETLSRLIGSDFISNKKQIAKIEDLSNWIYWCIWMETGMNATRNKSRVNKRDSTLEDVMGFMERENLYKQYTRRYKFILDKNSNGQTKLSRFVDNTLKKGTVDFKEGQYTKKA